MERAFLLTVCGLIPGVPPAAYLDLDGFWCSGIPGTRPIQASFAAPCLAGVPFKRSGHPGSPGFALAPSDIPGRLHASCERRTGFVSCPQGRKQHRSSPWHDTIDAASFRH